MKIKGTVYKWESKTYIWIKKELSFKFDLVNMEIEIGFFWILYLIYSMVKISF